MEKKNINMRNPFCTRNGRKDPLFFHMTLKSYKSWLWTAIVHQHFELQSLHRLQWPFTKSKAFKPHSSSSPLATRSMDKMSSPSLAFPACLPILYVFCAGYPLLYFITSYRRTWPSAPPFLGPSLLWTSKAKLGYTSALTRL